MATIRAWATRRRRTLILIASGLAVGALIAGLVAVSLHLHTRRHRASSYGVQDPGNAALRLENRTNDFLIVRLIVEDPSRTATIADLYPELMPGERQVLELPAGEYRATVRFIEIMRTPTYLSEKDLLWSLSLAPGEAVILSLEDGIASAETGLYLPPRLVTR